MNCVGCRFAGDILEHGRFNVADGAFDPALLGSGSAPLDEQSLGGDSTESQFGLEDELILHKCGDARLDQRTEPSKYQGFHMDGFSRARRAQDLRGSNSGEFQIGKRCHGGVGLGDNAGELGGGLNQEHAGEERMTGKMPGQKRFITTHQVFTGAAPARKQPGEAIEKTELRSVRQGFESGQERIVQGRQG